MSDTDSPEQGSGNDSALSVEAGAAAIENLLSRVPETAEEADEDSAANEESSNAEKTAKDASDDNASEEAPDEGDEGLEFDDETTDAEADAPKEPEFKAGQFAAHDAKVKLEDGTTISVAELIAGNMFQRTFTQKTTALSQEKKALEEERSQFAETKQQIEQQRNVILTLAQELIPQEPQPVDPDQDPIGYMNYLHARDDYQAKMNKLQGLWNAAQQEQEQLTVRQRQEQEEAVKAQQEQYQRVLRAEAEKFYSVMPRLKDKAELQKFREDAIAIGQSVYGIAPEEIDSIVDHRYLRIYADAMAFRKALAKRDAAKASTPQAQQTPQPRIQQRQRMAPQSSETRDSNTAADRLRKTGSIEDAAKALMKFV